MGVEEPSAVVLVQWFLTGAVLPTEEHYGLL